MPKFIELIPMVRDDLADEDGPVGEGERIFGPLLIHSPGQCALVS